MIERGNILSFKSNERKYQKRESFSLPYILCICTNLKVSKYLRKVVYICHVIIRRWGWKKKP